MVKVEHSEILLHTGDNGHHKQINKQEMLERLWRKGNPSELLVGMQIGAATVENSMEFSQKTKMKLPLEPVIPLLGIYPKIPKYQFKRTYAPQCS